MSSVAVCTSLYEAGRPYLDAFIQGVRSACEGHDVTLVAAIHGLRDPVTSLAPANDFATVMIERVPLTKSIAAVRQSMLLAAAKCDVEFLILNDMDDFLLPGAVTAHASALLDADFSYGDMVHIDASGAQRDQTFFQDCGVPVALAGESGLAAILGRNFLGFSNTAMRRHCVDPLWLDIPDDLVAVDWWFFTMLLQQGYRGAKAEAAVTGYRTYDGNILGGIPNSDPRAVWRRIDINRRHCAAFAAGPVYEARRNMLDRLATWIEREGDQAASEIEAACGEPGVWFDDIARLAERVGSNG